MPDDKARGSYALDDGRKRGGKVQNRCAVRRGFAVHGRIEGDGGESSRNERLDERHPLRAPTTPSMEQVDRWSLSPDRDAQPAIFFQAAERGCQSDGEAIACAVEQVGHSGRKGPRRRRSQNEL